MPGFVWYELLTPDVDASTRFYETVVGWRIADAGVPGMDYRLLHAGDTMVGGMMAPPHGAPSMWMGYAHVTDVDGAVADLKEKGGTVYRPPGDIPNIGRFSVVADPQGAVFTLFAPAPQPAPPVPPFGEGVGQWGWNELLTSDREGALGFYISLLGWTKDAAHDLGPMGVYQMVGDGQRSIGGLFQTGNVPPHWLFYANVDAIDPAADRIRSAGGQIANGPTEVPGGTWIVQAHDPHGTLFALAAPKRS